MNKFFTKVASLCVGLAMAAGVGVAVSSVKAERVRAAVGSVVYTLDGTITATGNAYATATNLTQNGISWSVVGNTELTPWRIGGKGLKNQDRAIYSSTAISQNIAEIKVSSGTTASSLSVNSLTISVHSTAADAASGSNEVASKQVTSGIANSVVTFTKEDSTSWAGKFYRVVYNVTRTSTSGNGYITLKSVTFAEEQSSGTTYDVTGNISNGSINVSSVAEGATLNATIVPDTWYSVPTSVTVTMGGSAVTPTYSNGVVTVENVTGAIVISGSCVAKEKPAHAGTLDDPYTIADAYLAIDENADTTNKYVSGIISGIVESWSTKYNNITFNISADGETSGNQLEAFRCVSSDEHTIASDDDVPTGASVVIYGSLTNYQGTYEFAAGCKIVKYTAPASSELTSITLSGDYPTSFDVSDTFSSEGLVVTAHYENGSERSVTNYSVSTPEMTSAGQKTVTVSYTENQVEKSAEYTIAVNAVTLWEISFKPGEGSGEMESVHVKEGADYTLPDCTFIAPEGKVFDYWEVNGVETTVISSVDDDYEVTAIYKDKPAEVTDTLNNGNTINKVQTKYESWTTEAMSSGAVYAGQSAGDKTSIQLRSNNSNSGVVSTTSGGDLVSVTINFNTDTAATRTVYVYGKTSSYSNPTELYNDTTKGTLLGEVNIDNGASQTIEVEGSYQYVGIRSKSGAMYIESIAIVWNGSVTPPEPKTVESISVSGAKTDFTVGDDFETTGLVVTAHYDDSSSSVVTSGYVVNSSAVDKTTAGVYTVTVTYEECSDSYDVTYTAPEPVVNKTYKKVKTNLANFSGDYLIVNEEASLVFNGSLETLDAENNVVSVTISDEKITAAESNEFTIAKTESAYSVKSHSGYYIGQTSDANGLKSSTSDPYDNAISYVNSEAVDMDIVSGGAHLRYNSASNQNRFRYYKSSSYTAQKAISLYMQVDDAEAVALEILNQTYADCQAFVDGESDYNTYKTKMAGIWTLIGTLFNAIEDSELKAKLVDGNADEDGTMLEQALARYDYLTAKYALDEVITGRDVPSLRYVPAYNTAIESDSAMIVVVIAAVVSLTSIAVLLVIKRRKTLVK